MIKSVLFDYGNVISVTNTGDCSDEMERMTGVPSKIFKTVYDRFRFEFDRGMISGAEMYRQLLIDAGYEKIANDTKLMKEIALLDLESWKEQRADVTEWGLSLKDKGFKIGILSNMPYEFLDLYEKKITLFNHADYACFSCRVKMIKPEKGIYEDCLKGISSKPEECVFFDDRSENIEAAKKIGIHAFLWTDLEKGKKDFESLLKIHN